MLDGAKEMALPYQQLQVRVYYADTDAAAVAHHTAYLRFFEQGRTEHLRQLGFELHALFEKYGIMFAIKNINISYRKPARLDDLLYIKTKVQEIKRASIIYWQSAYLPGVKDELLAEAVIKLACVNANMRPCALPDIFKKLENT